MVLIWFHHLQTADIELNKQETVRLLLAGGKRCTGFPLHPPPFSLYDSHTGDDPIRFRCVIRVNVVCRQGCRTLCEEALLKIRGVISFTFQMAVKRCIVRVRSDLKAEVRPSGPRSGT